MTIKEIARLANVSPTTVSKVINNKCGNISPETCERVRHIVKQYNYVPYTNSMVANTSQTFVVALLLHGGISNTAMVNAILLQASAAGYSTIVCISNSSEDEAKNIAMLVARRVDGVLWQQVDPGNNSLANEQELAQQGIAYFTLNTAFPLSERNLGLDFSQAGYTATKALVNARHQRLACINPAGGMEMDAFYSGFRQCLYKNSVALHGTQHITWGRDINTMEPLLRSCTGFVCYNTEIASSIARQAEQKGFSIPRNLSIVSLNHGVESVHLPFSTLPIPYHAFGVYCFNALVVQLEGKRAPKAFRPQLEVQGTGIDIPLSARGKKIVVVGALNVDTTIHVGDEADVNGNTAATDYETMPGGRGLNHAVAAAKYGADVYLIGCRGTDYEGTALMDTLLDNRIDVSGVKCVSQSTTGRAYIHLQDSGSSTIVSVDGANKHLSPAEIENAGKLFENASYCLLQSDIRMDTVEAAAAKAKQHGAQVFLKTAFIKELVLSDDLLANVDVLLPNIDELNYLCPGESSLEEKAQHFINRGVGTVIVTLGDKGCYLHNAERTAHYPVAMVQPMDMTGAADVFTATLAACLADEKTMDEAICYANHAAGLSTTGRGISASIADRATLERFIEKNTVAASKQGETHAS